MATFPAIAPVHPAPKQTSISSGALLLGDGYERATRFGINSVRPEWRLTWEVSAADVATIEAFLQARADAGDSFDWQPPDAMIALRWRCDEWSIEQVAYNWFRFSATFRRVFELTAIPALTPAAATCSDDDLCESDLSPKPVITYTGVLSFDQTLTATVACTTATWQWLRNGLFIAGATASTYILTQADLGAEITVKATCLGLSPNVSDPVYPQSPCTGVIGQAVTGMISPTGTTTIQWDDRILLYKNTAPVPGYNTCAGLFEYGDTGVPDPGTATITGGISSMVVERETAYNVWNPVINDGPCGGWGNSARMTIVRPNGTKTSIFSLASQGQAHDYVSLGFVNLRFSSTEPDAVDAATYFGGCISATAPVLPTGFSNIAGTIGSNGTTNVRFTIQYSYWDRIGGVCRLVGNSAENAPRTYSPGPAPFSNFGYAAIVFTDIFGTGTCVLNTSFELRFYNTAGVQIGQVSFNSPGGISDVKVTSMVLNAVSGTALPWHQVWMT